MPKMSSRSISHREIRAHIVSQLPLKFMQKLAYKYQVHMLMEKHLLRIRQRQKHDFGRIRATGAAEEAIND